MLSQTQANIAEKLQAVYTSRDMICAVSDLMAIDDRKDVNVRYDMCDCG